MSSIIFGAPVQDSPLGADNDVHTQAGEPEVEVDLNDPALTSEVIKDNAQADAYATLPPVPDAKYRAKLRQRDVKDPKGKPVKFTARMADWFTPPKPYFVTAVDAEILDPTHGKYDGITLIAPWVKTIPNRSETSEANSIVRACGIDTPEQATQKEYMDQLLGVLAREPEVLIETEWEWQCQNCRDKAKKNGTRYAGGVYGEFRFPVGKVAGTHDPTMRCPVCGNFETARPRIKGFFTLPGVKAGVAKK